MSYLYLTELGNWLRGAGLSVIEMDGWQTRARGSSGFTKMPLCVMWHHTASSPSWDGQKDADYITYGDEDAPLANLYIERSGTVWVLAAGATNTNGKGKTLTFSRGTVPENSMNTHAIGVEMGNNGVGEPWPEAQINAAFVVNNVCNRNCGNQPTDLSTHQFYAPDRKIDPATASAVQGSWQPRSCTSSGTWNVDDIRAEATRRATRATGDDEDMFDGIWKRENDDTLYAIYKNGTKLWLMDQPMWDGMVNLQAMRGASPEALSVRTCEDPGLFAAMGLVIGPNPAGRDAWGNLV